MREMNGEVGKKAPKKEMNNPSFFDVTWLIFEILCPVPMIIHKITPFFRFQLVVERLDTQNQPIKIK